VVAWWVGPPPPRAGPGRRWSAPRHKEVMANSHAAFQAQMAWERRHDELHRAKAQSVDVFGTPRREYRPVLGCNGTPAETANSFFEQRLAQTPRQLSDGTQRQLPHLSTASPRASPRVPNRLNEANLERGVPPHQAHHHHFGWTLGAVGHSTGSPDYSPARRWNVGLSHANEIAPVQRAINNCPDSARRTVSSSAQPSPRWTTSSWRASPRARLRAAGFNASYSTWGNSNKSTQDGWSNKSHQESAAQLSTGAPSDGMTEFSEQS